MSRRPAAPPSKSGGIPRAASSASVAMPPPRLPTSASTRPASSLSANEEGSRPTSPRKTSTKRAPGTTAVAGASSGKSENGEINIQVVVRCRGRSPQELSSSSPIITTTSGPLSKSITVETTPVNSSSLGSFTTASTYGAGGPTTKTYPFDKVFGPEADQTMVFREVAEGMLDEVLAGYNCTIFAYGQTGTGKTYTMQGDLELSPLLAPNDGAGIVPRVLHRLFTLLEQGNYTEYSVKCSYVELYNEELRDLLSPDYSPATAGERQPMAMANGTIGGLKLFEDGKKGVTIQGLEELGTRNLKEALALVNKGCQRRQVAETKMNTESSRSHTIFSITVHVKETAHVGGGEDLLRIGKFNLVDLAGSEAIGRSGATDKRAREAGMINQSLLTLGRVISALVEKGSHIPYRESKLTRLLQDSLGGRTKTCIVATVSPTRSNMEETLSTLDYAIRAKSIRNRPEINAHMTKTGLLKEYLGDIDRLRAEVMAAREKNGIYIPEDQWKEMHEAQAKMKSDYEEAKHRANAATVELATKKKDFEELTTKFIFTSEELERTREAERALGVLIEQTKNELEVTKVMLEEEKVVAEAFIKGEHKLDRVAGGLRDLANASVKDVGGLFEKIARKAKVLGQNADAATRFGSDLQSLSAELRTGLATLQTAQEALGRDLQSSLNTFESQAQTAASQELAALDAAFASYTNLSKSLARSIEQGKADSAETGTSIRQISDDVQQSVRAWAKDTAKKSGGMVEGLMAQQQEQLTLVGNVLESTATLVDTVIETARGHVAKEAAAQAKAKETAEATANAEISRLRAQNVLLAKLLTEEKAKSATLRTSLINNLTSLIVDFTDTQDKSWSEAVSKMQIANNAGVDAMTSWIDTSSQLHASSSSRANAFGTKLDEAESSNSAARASGTAALDNFNEAMRTTLEGYGQETAKLAEGQVEVVDGFCGKLGGAAKDAAIRGEKRAAKQTEKLGGVNKHALENLQNGQARSRSMVENASTVSSALLASHENSSASFTAAHATSTTTLDNILATTATFLSTGILEDVPTGITPRKKAWNVPTSWDRVQPREALLEAFRSRQVSEPIPSSSAPTTGIPAPSRQHQSAAEEPSLQIPTPSSDSLDVENQNPNPLAMSTGLRAPKARVPSGHLKKPSASMTPEEKERMGMGMQILAEGAMNVPRRTRK